MQDDPILHFALPISSSSSRRIRNRYLAIPASSPTSIYLYFLFRFEKGKFKSVRSIEVNLLARRRRTWNNQPHSRHEKQRTTAVQPTLLLKTFRPAEGHAMVESEKKMSLLRCCFIVVVVLAFVCRSIHACMQFSVP